MSNSPEVSLSPQLSSAEEEPSSPKKSSSTEEPLNLSNHFDSCVFLFFTEKPTVELPAAPFLTTPVANSLYFLRQYKFAPDYAAPRIAYCRLLEAQESIDTK